MSSAARLVVGGTLVGLFAAATMAAYRQPAPSPAALPVPASNAGPGMSNTDLHRCLAITLPDNACTAVWEAEHHRFFGDAPPALPPTPAPVPIPHQDEVQP